MIGQSYNWRFTFGFLSRKTTGFSFIDFEASTCAVHFYSRDDSLIDLLFPYVTLKFFQIDTSFTLKSCQTGNIWYPVLLASILHIRWRCVLAPLILKTFADTPFLLYPTLLKVLFEHIEILLEFKILSKIMLVFRSLQCKFLRLSRV